MESSSSCSSPGSSRPITPQHHEQESSLQSDPYPECSICHNIVQCEWTRRPGRVEKSQPIMIDNERNWSASRLFHSPCASCAERETSEISLCHFCQHLRFRHLSLCAPAVELPANVPINEPDQDSDCPLCQFFLRVSRRVYISSTERRAELHFPLYLSATKWRAGQVQWRVLSSDMWSTAVEFLVVQDDNQPLPVLPPLRLEMGPLQSCISHCLKDHKSCSGEENTTFPPSFRLFDVERRCLMTPTHTLALEYVALSYVWGDSSNTDWSTTSNILQRMEHLDTSTQPAAIKDAITVCERLGERFIWADRLCILQDDEGDKSLQVGAMASIYSAAKFVIIDASGSNMNDGLVGVGRARNAQVSEKLCGLTVNVQLPPLWDVVERSPWNSRGWTYQEAILPKRKLFFTGSQIFYECAHRIQHEETLAYSSFDPSEHDKIHYPTSTTSLRYGAEEDEVERLRRTNLNRSEEKPWQAFARHLSRYRQRKLRYTSDILNAFSAIMDALYAEGKSYHGCPLPDIDLALLWKLWKDPYVRRKPLRPAREIQDDFPGSCPSWSWTSAPHIIPGYEDIYQQFCGSLCLWFQPDVTEEQLQPIIADACAVSTWHRSPGPFSSPGTDRDSIRLLFARRVLPSGMIESSACAEASARALDGPREVTDELRARWPSYAAFWQDVFGREEDMRGTQARVLEDTHGKVRDGVLVTRAQVASVVVTKHMVKEGFISRSEHQGLGVLSPDGHLIGSLLPGPSEQTMERIDAGAGTFECIALSISYAMERRKEPNKKGASPGEHSGTMGSGRPEVSLGMVYVVNAMLIRRDGGYCYRVGLANIDLDCWIALARNFETIVLS